MMGNPNIEIHQKGARSGPACVLCQRDWSDIDIKTEVTKINCRMKFKYWQHQRDLWTSGFCRTSGVPPVEKPGRVSIVTNYHCQAEAKLGYVSTSTTNHSWDLADWNPTKTRCDPAMLKIGWSLRHNPAEMLSSCQKRFAMAWCTSRDSLSVGTQLTQQAVAIGLLPAASENVDGTNTALNRPPRAAVCHHCEQRLESLPLLCRWRLQFSPKSHGMKNWRVSRHINEWNSQLKTEYSIYTIAE